MRSGSVTAHSENHLELTIDRPATLWLQLVSLFPPTYHGRRNGNRADIMEKLAAMHPAFLRFPGGNYLEGGRIEEHFDWRKMIGPLVGIVRHTPALGDTIPRTAWGCWSSWSGARTSTCSPFSRYSQAIRWAGQVVKPGPALDPYVQEALDEIEYVTGGAETKWGALRARDGHPAPFALRYVEVGNEDKFDKAQHL